MNGGAGGRLKSALFETGENTGFGAFSVEISASKISGFVRTVPIMTFLGDPWSQDSSGGLENGVSRFGVIRSFCKLLVSIHGRGVQNRSEKSSPGFPGRLTALRAVFY